MITVAGLTPSLDLTYSLEQLELGEIHRVPEVVRCAGGKALNMARAASRVGADCAVVVILGGPTGIALSEMLQAEGLAVTVVPSPAETRICVSLATADSAGLTEIYQEAAAVPATVWATFCSELTSALRTRPGWLALSGRAPAGSSEMIAELVRRGQRAGVRVALDCSGDALGPALAARPALVKINRYEAAGQLEVDAATDLLTMATALAEGCGATVVLTDGPAGALAVAGGMALYAPVPGPPGRYPVGSGDSFLGGLLAELDRGKDLRGALVTATGCAVANALAPGQGHFPAEAVARVAAEVELHEVS